MFNENDEFDDCSSEPPSFVAGGVKPQAAPQRKIGVSAGVGSIGLPAPLPGEAAGDDLLGNAEALSALAGGVRALNMKSAGGVKPPVPNVAELPQDDVFDYDPGFQEDPNQEYTPSDVDEDDEEDASSANDNSLADEEAEARGSSSSSSRQAQKVANFSTSVPINMPQLSNYQRLRSQRDQDSPDDGRRPGAGEGGVPTTSRSRHMKPDDMAASIQALARSVHADSSEMVFGELPKSRTHISRTLSNQPSEVAPCPASNLVTDDHDLDD